MALHGVRRVFWRNKLKLSNGSPRGKASILEKQIEAAKASKLDQPHGSGFSPTFVFDSFSNRFKGVKLDVSKLPNNLLLTTENNFETVVGPVYKRTFEVLEVENLR